MAPKYQTPSKRNLDEDAWDVARKGFGTKCFRSPSQFGDDVSTAAPSPVLTCTSEPSPCRRPTARSFDDSHQSCYMLPSIMTLTGFDSCPESSVSPALAEPAAQAVQTPRASSPPPITPRDRIIIRDPARSPPPAPRPGRRSRNAQPVLLPPPLWPSLLLPAPPLAAPH
jgi:hypothetical protein